MSVSPFTPNTGGAGGEGGVLAVRLTPKGGKDALDGIAVLSDGRAVLKARVRALPESGHANIALIALLAKALDVPKSRIALISGATSRLKMLRIEAEPEALAARIATICP